MRYQALGHFTEDDEGPCARLFREVLARLATEDVTDEVIEKALSRARLNRMPDHALDFASFASGPAYETITELLGEEAAEAILTDLGPALGSVGGAVNSGVRRAVEVEPPDSEAPIVIIGTRHSDERLELMERLSKHARPILVKDVVGLIDAVERHKDADVTVVIRNELIPSRRAALATLSRILSPSGKVVVFGLHSFEAPPGTTRWLRMDHRESLNRVADAARSMFPPDIHSRATPMVERPRLRIVVVAHADAEWSARCATMLHHAGYTTLCVPDGFTALERCIDEKPHAVVVARQISGVDGPRLAQMILRRFGDDGPKVIVIDDEPLAYNAEGVTAQVGTDDRQGLLGALELALGT